MTREIKFRAWDQENKVMEYNVNINQGKPVKQGYQWFNTENTVHHSTLMQYTGLKDKNGVEIYEGDVVKYTQVLYTDCSRKEVLSIKEPVLARMYYSDGIYLAMKIGDLGRILLPGLIDSDELEVMGNIYENRSLLNDSKNTETY